MSDILKNMSAPPRSSVVFNKVQIQKYISFNPLTLKKLLNELGYKGEINKMVEEYVNNNPNIIKNIKRPSGYMLGVYIEFNKELDLYKYEECTDLELLILVFCSTVGDLYIPNKELGFEENKFDKILLFAEEEVNS